MTTGIVVAVFVVMWGVTGSHLAYPPVGEAIIEWFEPFDELNPVERTGDTVSYWMSYLHFGRLGGYVPGCDRRCLRPCDQDHLDADRAGPGVPRRLRVLAVAAWSAGSGAGQEQRRRRRCTEATAHCRPPRRMSLCWRGRTR